MTDDLKIIKKLYGEAMMHFCRDAFSTILEIEGLLSDILQKNFAPSHVLYEDLVTQQKTIDFKNYIYDLFCKENEEKPLEDIISVQELLRQAGYTLYECKSEADIQLFKKYYAKGEALCTFNGGRLKMCYVFFAVKDNAETIRREDFKDPKRQDEYGTSVISIQFSKDDTHILSIKNRYNHTVNNPDATFSNNLDNIVRGLTKAFEKDYGLVQKYVNDDFEMPWYVRANDGRWYKYNYEWCNVYYCPDNIVINYDEVKRYPKEKYLIFDYFILNLETKEIICNGSSESFKDVIGKIEKIVIEKNGDIKYVTFINQNNDKFIIGLNKLNQIISFKSDDIKDIGDNFFVRNLTLSSLEVPNLQTIGNSFLSCNKALKSLSLPNLKSVGFSFLYDNRELSSLDLPKLYQVDRIFLPFNQKLKKLNLPELHVAGDNFLYMNAIIDEVNLPNLEAVGTHFMCQNKMLGHALFPNVVRVGEGFLSSNNDMKSIEMPRLTLASFGFLNANKAIEIMNLPELRQVGKSFMSRNTVLKKAYFPKLVSVGDYFLSEANQVQEIELSNLREAGDSFLEHNYLLDSISVPSLEKIGKRYFATNVKARICIEKQIVSGKSEKLEEKVRRRVHEN